MVNFYKNLLGHVLRFFRVSEQRKRGAIHAVLVTVDQGAKRGLVPALQLCYQLYFSIQRRRNRFGASRRLKG
ncbi:hypothetical protein GCM10027044_24130 [Hymenobacter ruber]